MDADILQELYERYYSRAMLYALSLCGDEELAKDLVSESFVRAYLSLPGETPSFPYWLMRVCKNLWLDHVRRHRRLTPLEEAAAIPSPDTPETVYLQSERSRALWKAIGKLSPLDREIVTLHYYSGLPLQQVACLAGRSYGATRQRLSRLRQKLKTELRNKAMTFKELFERYRSGDATEEERRTVEEELEKAALINDYLFGKWEAEPSEVPAAEFKQVKRSLRKRNIALVLTSVVLVIALLLCIPLVEMQYFDPNQHTTPSHWKNDLDLALECYYELFTHEQDYVGFSSVTDTGFGTWSVELMYQDSDVPSMHTYRTATVDKNDIHFPKNTLFYSPTDLFDFGPLALPPESVGNEAVHQTGYMLQELEEDTSIYAAVSFGADLTAQELFDLADRYGLIIRWAGVRVGTPSEPLTPLIGMKLDGYREDCGINELYPDFAGPITAYNTEQHFRSMVEYVRDYEQNTMNIGVIEDPEYYDKVLAQLDEDGLLFYGAYVDGQVQTFRDMAADGVITDFYMLEIRESSGYFFFAPSFGG